MKARATPAPMYRELGALRAVYRLGFDNDVITAMPRIKLLPENKAGPGRAARRPAAARRETGRARLG